MSVKEKVEEYIIKNEHFAEELRSMRELLLDSGMQETIKWGAPVYTIDGKNVAGMAAFKNHYAIWFYNGVLLKDKDNILVSAKGEKTKALRQWRFEKGDEQNKALIMSYLVEAIENQKKGLEIKPESKPEIIPDTMKRFFEEDQELEEFFNKLTRGKRIEYGEFIAEAKQDKTKIKRMEKIIPLIKEGKGLYEKYKNC
ncbi:MAG: DUF1801 domain-containing protein [Flavobacteriaceae bacterium]|nr:DUF1801 domain-containing protein [Flavobacteriaceae bacterium]